MTHSQNSHVVELTQTDADGEKAAHVALYRSILQEPVASLAGNVNDRPDVATAAILGYN
ncbi:hypothetical protein PPMP20_17280 [Paraburkholderia phymatum]|uniref:Uncharacterized protein n=1 Tax=Paraburkholderia phymatum (strain DSM 17167 / CIP 108236 / LMG 21445 / STM815) TaxID=391038 RepID=B2JTB7_PARP8|nr:hypothetical protein [Paraburkholderia phymatum]ACC75820.1 conserved hypothetical protein [Paraburkholderia phymatum STM815]